MGADLATNPFKKGDSQLAFERASNNWFAGQIVVVFCSTGLAQSFFVQRTLLYTLSPTPMGFFANPKPKTLIGH